ncbi:MULTISPECIES: hypothetical protein [Nostocaceae]|nr:MULTISPECIES: hypothetical protein [Nostocaceae]MBD2477942.1 hypothetical protein [Anabaena sp. FACHB-83]
MSTEYADGANGYEIKLYLDLGERSRKCTTTKYEFANILECNIVFNIAIY